MSRIRSSRRTRCIRSRPHSPSSPAASWDQGTEHFQPTTFQVSNLNAGTGAPNVIPGELKARFNLRYSPVQTQEGLKETVEGILRKHGVRYTLEWYVSGEPFYTPPGALLERGRSCDRGSDGIASEALHRRRDVRRTVHRALGAQVVELGVVNATIHKVKIACAWRRSTQLHRMYLERAAEACWLERLAASVGHDTAARPEPGPDQNPRRHREPEEPPVHLAALPAAGEHLADHLETPA